MECNGCKILTYVQSGVLFDTLKAALGRLGEYLPRALSEQVDLAAYTRKLVKYACIDLALSPDGQIVGILAHYSNDRETRKAYGTFFSIAPEYRGTGIAKVMMQLLIDTAKTSGMSVIEIKVVKDNARAQALYRKFGFLVVSEASPEKVIMSRRLD